MYGKVSYRKMKKPIDQTVTVWFKIKRKQKTIQTYDTRADGKTVVYGWEQIMDKRFGDERMEKIYPNAIQQ